MTIDDKIKENNGAFRVFKWKVYISVYLCICLVILRLWVRVPLVAKGWQLAELSQDRFIRGFNLWPCISPHPGPVFTRELKQESCLIQAILAWVKQKCLAQARIFSYSQKCSSRNLTWTKHIIEQGLKVAWEIFENKHQQSVLYSMTNCLNE